MKKIIREPFLHFIIIGAVLFILTGWVDKERRQADQQIVIDQNIIERMTNQYQQQMGRPLGEEGLNAMVNQYIQNEIYYREAVKIGLDDNDEIIHRRLSQKYMFLLTDLDIPKKPTDDELMKFYSDNLSLFRNTGTLSFIHVYFSPDVDGNDGAQKRAQQVFEKIADSGIEVPSQLGDPFPLDKKYTNITQLEVRNNFGASAFTDSIFKIPTHHWSHPIESGYGWHLIYIESTKQADIPPFESVKKEVLEAWQNENRKQHGEKKNKELLSQYTIVKTYLKAK